MLILIFKRIGFMVITMLIVSMLLFLLLEFDKEGVAVRVLGPYSSEEQRAIWLEDNGYNDPLYVRYFSWLGRFASGDFGESVRFKVPVSEVMWPRLWNTAILGFWVFAVMIPLSLALGILAGMREGSKLDRSRSSLFTKTARGMPSSSAMFQRISVWTSTPST